MANPRVVTIHLAWVVPSLNAGPRQAGRPALSGARTKRVNAEMSSRGTSIRLHPILLDLPIKRSFPDAENFSRLFAVAADHLQGVPN
jgi:hypothetical protein